MYNSIHTCIYIENSVHSIYTSNGTCTAQMHVYTCSQPQWLRKASIWLSFKGSVMGLYMCNILPPHSSTPPHSTSLSPSLSFLDEIQEQMAGVEDEAVVVKDLFDLIHQYQVPTPPEDLAVYQVQSACSLALRLHMENKSRAWEKGYSAYTCTRFRWISPGTECM